MHKASDTDLLQNPVLPGAAAEPKEAAKLLTGHSNCWTGSFPGASAPAFVMKLEMPSENTTTKHRHWWTSP